MKKTTVKGHDPCWISAANRKDNIQCALSSLSEEELQFNLNKYIEVYNSYAIRLLEAERKRRQETQDKEIER